MADSVALLVAGSVASADAARCSFRAGGTIDVSDGDELRGEFPPDRPPCLSLAGRPFGRTEGGTAERWPLRLKMGPAVSDGVDTLGAYDSIKMEWDSAEASSLPPKDALMTTTFRCYRAGFLVFEQAFPRGLKGTMEGRDVDSPSSVFPSFNTSSWENEMHTRLVTFAGQNAEQSTRFGDWPGAYAVVASRTFGHF